MIEQRIAKRVSDCNAAAPCIVKIKDITDFHWDQLYVFESGAPLDPIEKSQDTDSIDVEFTRRIVLVKDGKLIYREAAPTDIERPTNGAVIFTEADKDRHWSYTPETAVFRAEKKTSNGGAYYVLTQMK